MKGTALKKRTDELVTISGIAAVRSVILLIRIYQIFLSPILPGTCRFHPTCSSYSQQAFEKYGLLKGFTLSIKRIVRCHPWHPGGFDPLP